MKTMSLRQRTLIGITAIALSLGGTFEIASAATTSSTRNLDTLTTIELADTDTSQDLKASSNESELVAIKFKKGHGRKFRKLKKKYIKSQKLHKSHKPHKGFKFSKGFKKIY